MESRIRSGVLVRVSSHEVNTKRTQNGVHWVALVVLALCPIGGYVSYDVPGALSLFYMKDLDLTLTQIGGLYTAYAVPCVILSPFCGTLAFQFGSHRLLIAGNVLSTLGSLGFAFATTLWAMILMRILFGLGLELLLVAGSILIEEWFRTSKYLGVAFGLVECFPLLGTLIAFALLPEVARQTTMRTSLLIALGICVICCFGSILYYRLLHPKLKIAKRVELEKPAENVFKLNWKAMKKAKKEFWLKCGYCFALDSTGFPFLAMASQFFYDKYGFSESFSTLLVCIFCIIAIVTGPILNFVIDRIGKRVTVSIFSAAMTSVSFFIFGFTNAHPAFGLVIAAVGYIIGCGTVYNLASRTADGEEEIGTLFSILAVFPNLTYLLMPLLFGIIKDSTGDYTWSCLFFAMVDVGGVVCMVVLKRIDKCDLDSKTGNHEVADVQLEIKTASQMQ